MRYDHDDRQPPDNLRRGQFKAGWKAAAAGVRYNEQTLVRLTWNNLGYRLALAFGAQAFKTSNGRSLSLSDMSSLRHSLAASNLAVHRIGARVAPGRVIAGVRGQGHEGRYHRYAV